MCVSDMHDFATIFLNNVHLSLLYCTILQLLYFKRFSLCSYNWSINVLSWNTFLNEYFVVWFSVVNHVPLNLWSVFSLYDVDHLCLLSDHFTHWIFYSASINKDPLAILIFSYLLLSSNYIAFCVLDDLYFLFHLLGLSLNLVFINSFNNLLFLAYFDSLLALLNFSNLGLRFYYIPYGIFNDVSLNNFGHSVLLNHIFLMLENRTILASLYLNSILFFPNHLTVGVQDLISFNHRNFALLLDNFRFMLMHISFLVAFNLHNVCFDPNDLASRIFNSISVNKCGFSLFLNQFLFMDMNIAELIDFYLFSSINHGFSLTFYFHSFRVLMCYLHLLRLSRALFGQLKHFAIRFYNLTPRILDCAFLNDKCSSIFLFDNVSLMLEYIIVLVLLDHLHVGLLWYHITLWIGYYVPFNDNFLILSINLVPFMFINIALLILSDLDNIRFELDDISVLISGNISLDNWSDSVLLFYVLWVLCRCALCILFSLGYIGFYLVRLSFLVL